MGHSDDRNPIAVIFVVIAGAIMLLCFVSALVGCADDDKAFRYREMKKNYENQLAQTEAWQTKYIQMRDQRDKALKGLPVFTEEEEANEKKDNWKGLVRDAGKLMITGYSR